MAEAVRVDELELGDHGCLTFSDPQERLDLLAAFVRDGLRQGQKVLCWTDSVDPEQLGRELLGRSVRTGSALRRGQLRFETMEASLLAGRTADALSMVDTLAEQLELAGREGYPGLRVTADMCWATRPLAAPEELLTFEQEVGALFADGRLCVICQYDRERFDAVTLAFAAKAHPRAVAALAYHDDALLRICRQYSPPGIRIAGELDYQHLDELNRALTETVRLDRHPHVNLTGLDYIDAACASAITHAALKLPAARRMTVTCHGLVRKVMELVGATGLTGTDRFRITAAP
ncbi:DcmR-like sensory protein [Micromonospora pisi]|uniref:DcmR-like sensory protein n=1 Tax=Micromonospora pisi TaxID=589240 RepID=A0A495JGW6_9ACTN|nr:DcmR-like sensory protein [Micromonospora pisi]